MPSERNGQQSVDAALRESLTWRCIGPHRGGRVVAVAADPVEPMTFYFGACAGGVWKTTDGGTYWENISDGFFKTAAVGAIAVSESDPNVIYVGTGETTIRGNVSHGDGVYKSTDGGKTWTNVGLAETRHIGKIRIHPDEPGCGLRRGARPRLGPEQGARRLPLEGRRQRPGSRCSSVTRGLAWPILRWTRTTRACSTPRFGRCSATRTN